ncbi:hypothetical protein llap_849 [Limosa lapponica baueri]|uniref:Uncharacterized protein n=1 Tax=Limosa lapponica baueri TaxID=1758121 RepID=A0A2I0US67_LIMLA|nr:hypothetical protein llap_849 [Limosa lapponica baueri]
MRVLEGLCPKPTSQDYPLLVLKLGEDFSTVSPRPFPVNLFRSSVQAASEPVSMASLPCLCPAKTLMPLDAQMALPSLNASSRHEHLTSAMASDSPPVSDTSNTIMTTSRVGSHRVGKMQRWEEESPMEIVQPPLYLDNITF